MLANLERFLKKSLLVWKVSGIPVFIYISYVTVDGQLFVCSRFGYRIICVCVCEEKFEY